MIKLSRQVVDPRIILVTGITLPAHWSQEFQAFVYAQLTAPQAVELLRLETQLIEGSSPPVPYFVEQQLAERLKELAPRAEDYPTQFYAMVQEPQEIGGMPINRYVELVASDLSIFGLTEEAEEYPQFPDHWTLLFRQYCIDVLSPDGVVDLTQLETNIRESAITFALELTPQQLDEHVSGLMDEMFTKSGVEAFPLKFVREGDDLFEIETKPVSTSETADMTQNDKTNQQAMPSHWLPEFQQFIQSNFSTGETRVLIRFEQNLLKAQPNIGRHALARKIRTEVLDAMRAAPALFSNEQIAALTWDIIDTNPDTPLDLGVDTGEDHEVKDVQMQVEEPSPNLKEAFDFAAPNAEVLKDNTNPLKRDVDFWLDWPAHWRPEFVTFLHGHHINSAQAEELIGYEQALRAGDVMFPDFDPTNQTLGEPRIIRELRNKIVEMFEIEDPTEVLEVEPFNEDVPFPPTAHDPVEPVKDTLMAHDESEESMSDAQASTSVETTAGASIDQFPVSDETSFDVATISEMDKFWSAAFIYSVANRFQNALLPSVKAAYLRHLDHGRKEFPGDEAMAKAYAEMNALRTVELDRQMALRVPADANLNVKVETMDELVASPVADAEVHIDKTMQATTKLDHYHPEIEEGPLPEFEGKFPLRVRRQPLPGGVTFSIVFLYNTADGRDIAWAALQEEHTREEQSVFGVPSTEIPRSHVPFDPTKTGHGEGHVSGETVMPPHPHVAVREYAARHPTAESIPPERAEAFDRARASVRQEQAEPGLKEQVGLGDPLSIDERVARLEKAVFPTSNFQQRDPAAGVSFQSPTTMRGEWRGGVEGYARYGARDYGFGYRGPYSAGFGGAQHRTQHADWGQSALSAQLRQQERQAVEHMEGELAKVERVYSGDVEVPDRLTRKQYGIRVGHGAMTWGQQTGLPGQSMFHESAYFERASRAYTRLLELASRMQAEG